MSLISFSNVSKYYGTEEILDHISFNINLKEKVALIGQNGTGKTTIFKLILKEIMPTLLPKEDKPGEISILGNTSIGYLNQNAITNINNTVYEELLLPFKETIKLEKEINSYDSSSLNDEESINKYNELIEKFEKLRGYTYLNEIKEMVSKFSFPLDILDRKVSSLSGGERMKIAFIKILLFNYDVLLLDEPTNHLDISTIEWLESFLKDYKGTILFISHDTYFISNLATKILELENHKVTTYNTTYENYLTLKKERYEYLLKEAKKEEIEIAKLKRFIEFYMPKPRFTSRAKDRVKKLEKIEKNRVEVPQNSEKDIKFKLDGGNLSYKQVLEFKDVTVGYDKPLIKPFSFTLYGQDNLAIVGDNGIGKTTLIKTIIKEIKPLSGEIKELRKVTYGYIKQNDFEFKENISALEFLKSRYPNKLEKELRNTLGRFYFRSDEVFKSTSSMSNGEKMRLLLSDLSLSSYDILLLDEPTNHLDMATKNSLIDALSNYKGIIIFISHDRYFINQLATSILYLSKDKSIYLEGNYDTLKEHLSKVSSLNTISINELNNKITKTKEVKPKLSNNKINEINKEIKDIEKKISEIDLELESDFTSYTEYDSLNKEKATLEDRYLELLNILEENK